jgi:hypothetical protein
VHEIDGLEGCINLKTLSRESQPFPDNPGQYVCSTRSSGALARILRMQHQLIKSTVQTQMQTHYPSRLLALAMVAAGP